MARESTEWANGRVRRPRPVQGAFAFLGQQAQGGQRFPVETIDPEVLASAIARWCGAGHAVSFGLSGDGGAFGVHLIAGGDKRSKWFATAQECEDFLTTVPGANGTEPG
jgi:hypothetical protein